MKKLVFPVIGMVLVLFTLASAGDGKLWVRNYGRSSDDEACAVLTDAEGNVIVVGSSPTATTAFDIVVLKYSPNGDSIWFKVIAGSGASNDMAKAAAVDASGAVYIAATTGTYPNYNILTLKLNPDGSEAWRAVYQGSAGGADEPAALALDGSGNVYVTGYESDGSGLPDYVTIKYDANGQQLWVANYDGGAGDKATALALGSDGSVYVTGWSVQSGNEDIVTIKYSNGGTQEWRAVYGSTATPEIALAIAVDASGNVYVTGKCTTQQLPAPYKYVTLKYSGTGTELWHHIYGSGQNAEPAGLALGGSALYVTGTVNTGTNTDIVTIAYNLNTGDTLWLRRFNGTANKNDQAAGVVVDAQGRVHIVGSSQNAAGNSDYCRLRYSSNGVLQGSEVYNSPYNNDDKGLAIALDPNLQVVVTGVCFWGMTQMSYDIVTVKFDSAAPGVAEPVSFTRVSRGLQIYPNPCRGVVNVKLEEGEGFVKLWRMDGALMKSERVVNGGAVYRLNLRGVPSGVYVLEAGSGVNRKREKLVVE